MATYVISDLHGEYELFNELLNRIKLQEDDTLLVLGDMVDRGKHPIQLIQKIMTMPNVICLAGNHEMMALECLNVLMTEITYESITKFNAEMIDRLMIWQSNGGQTTMDEFIKLRRDEQYEVIKFLENLPVYERIQVQDKEYLLVHAGPGNVLPRKNMEKDFLQELLWTRTDYDKQYFKDIYVVTGHTPTQEIKGNPKPGYIYRNKNNIAIDCGCYRDDGRLAALCLDTGEEFYVSKKAKGGFYA